MQRADFVEPALDASGRTDFVECEPTAVEPVLDLRRDALDALGRHAAAQRMAAK